MKFLPIVFSGGGAVGLEFAAAAAGALWASGYEPSALAGTSAGSLVSLLLASGIPGPDVMRIVGKLKTEDILGSPSWTDNLSLAWSILRNRPARSTHLYAVDRIRRTLVKAGAAATWEALTVSWCAYAVRWPDGAVVPLTTGGPAPTPIDAAIASMAIPAIFPPAIFDATGSEYVDGGVADNLPWPESWRNAPCVLVVSQGRPLIPTDTGARSRILWALLWGHSSDIPETIADAVCGAVGNRILWASSIRETGGLLNFSHAHQDMSAAYEFFCRQIAAWT